VTEAVLAHPWAGRAVRVGAGVGVAAAAFAAGVALTAIVVTFADASPWALLALPLAPLLALLVIAAPTVGVLLVVLAFPVGTLQVPTGVFPLQAVEAAVLVVVTVVVVRRLAVGRLPLPWSPPLWWAVLLLGWTLIGLQSAVDESLALKQIASLFGGLLLSAAVLAACRHMDDLRLVLGGFVAVSAGIAVASYAGGIELQSAYGAQTVAGRLDGAFDHPNQLGSLCGLAAPTALGLAFGARTRLGRGAAWCAFALVGLALLFTLSRGAWVGTALALLLMIVALPEARRAVVLLAVPAVVVAVFVTTLAPVGGTEIAVVGQRVGAITALSPYDDRPTIYREAMREIRDDPLTGQGAGGFPVASARAGSEVSTIYVEHAHNLWLTWGAEAGIPAILFILGFMISLALAARRAGREFRRAGRLADRAITVGLAAALLSVVGQGLFDYVFRNSVANVALWAVIGALLVCRREALRASEPSP
jgi:putative inorganic carbon (hco3(-)) transporter